MADFDVEKLLKQIKELEAELKAAKKYGLVWDKENTKEEVVLLCEKYIPTLSLIKSLNIKKGGLSHCLIEGDNFHSLTCLNYVLQDSFDLIYIDPPYNTGSEDFLYNDNYINSDDTFLHSKWLNFMQKRLTLARNLLKQDGVIFISIDDNEQANLKILCDQVFGPQNFVNCVVVKMSEMSGVKMSHVEKKLPKQKEYCLVYSKNRVYYSMNPIKNNRLDNLDDFAKYAKYYSKIIVDKSKPVEEWEILPLDKYLKRIGKSNLTEREILQFKLDNAERMIYRTNNKSFEKIQCDKPVQKIISATGIEYIWWEGKQMLFLSDYTTTFEGDLWTDISTINLNKEGGVDYQNGKKPLKLLSKIISTVKNKNAFCLDFFAGSGSFGEAVLMANAEDGGKRRFILCQSAEENDIAKIITYPRLKTVITGIKKDGSKYSDGLSGSLYYYKTDFIKNEANTEQAKYNLVEKVDALLCLAENIFDEVERNDYSSHFMSGNKHLFIYNDYYNADKFNEFKDRVLSANGEKIVYVYSSDNNVDETLIDSGDVVVKPIPSKIYEIYKEIVEDIKRGE